jgi:hypothetical protein
VNKAKSSDTTTTKISSMGKRSLGVELWPNPLATQWRIELLYTHLWTESKSNHTDQTNKASHRLIRISSNTTCAQMSLSHSKLSTRKRHRWDEAAHEDETSGGQIRTASEQNPTHRLAKWDGLSTRPGSADGETKIGGSNLKTQRSTWKRWAGRASWVGKTKTEWWMRLGQE